MKKRTFTPKQLKALKVLRSELRRDRISFAEYHRRLLPFYGE